MELFNDNEEKEGEEKKKRQEPILQGSHAESLRVYIFFFLFDCIPSMWKFPDKGSNLHHSSNLSQSSDDARSLTC